MINILNKLRARAGKPSVVDLIRYDQLILEHAWVHKVAENRAKQEEIAAALGFSGIWCKETEMIKNTIKESK